jgi:AcrR family transcriptional regulator
VPRTRKPPLDPRKQPAQARSAQLVKDLLEAAVRVLSREGPERFTTIRVARAAGVSVGSLYQYFPNKHAILYRLQVEEWSQTGALIERIVSDRTTSPAQRMRTMMRAFFRSECDEAPLRLALDALAPSFHSAPEAVRLRRRGQAVVRRFIAEATPHATLSQRRFAAEFVFVTITALGKQVSERKPSTAQVERWADALSDMLNQYLENLGAAPGARPAWK